MGVCVHVSVTARVRGGYSNVTQPKRRQGKQESRGVRASCRQLIGSGKAPHHTLNCRHSGAHTCLFQVTDVVAGMEARFGVAPDVFSLNAVLKAHVAAGDVEAAMRLLHGMEADYGVPPDLVSVNTVRRSIHTLLKYYTENALPPTRMAAKNFSGCEVLSVRAAQTWPASSQPCVHTPRVPLQK